MRYFFLLPVVLMVALSIGCGKTNSAVNVKPQTPGGTNGGLAFANTDYIGTMIELDRQYPKPILLHFNADSTVMAYALFWLQVHGTPYYEDSVPGKIVKIDTGSSGGLSATVILAATADTQVYNFTTDLSEVSGGSGNSNQLALNQFFFTDLQKVTKAPASLINSYWTTAVSTVNDQTLGDIYYPDINGVGFSNPGTDSGNTGWTTYIRNGQAVTVGMAPTIITLAVKFFQTGSRVYFSGYDEDYAWVIGYWGVISNDGNTIIADSRSGQARVPIQGQTDNYYGFSYETPLTYRQK